MERLTTKQIITYARTQEVDLKSLQSTSHAINIKNREHLVHCHH